MKKINEYWTDHNNNKWKVNITKKEAIEKSKSLIDCKNCIDCENCKNCYGCTDCYNCKWCTNCINCRMVVNRCDFMNGFYYNKQPYKAYKLKNEPIVIVSDDFYGTFEEFIASIKPNFNNRKNFIEQIKMLIESIQKDKMEILLELIEREMKKEKGEIK